MVAIKNLAFNLFGKEIDSNTLFQINLFFLGIIIELSIDKGIGLFPNLNFLQKINCLMY